MKHAKWVLFAIALGMMAATAGWLDGLQNRHLLGPPGVKLGPVSIHNELGALVAAQGVLLPEQLPGIPSTPGAITRGELTALPEDTTFGRRFYQVEGTRIQNTVVLMGTDHTSIHEPQYCLYAQGWKVAKKERITIPMTKPFSYEIPALKLTSTIQFLSNNVPMTMNCLYIYWFVSGDETDKNRITAEEGSRLWSGWVDTLRKGQIERWAYISYFAACLPGAESVTFDRIRSLIQAGVPEFQRVEGAPLARMGAGASEQAHQ